MGNLIDGPAELPLAPVTAFERWMSNAINYSASYNAAHDSFLARGWSFEDELADDIGSIEHIRTVQPGVFDGEAHESTVDEVPGFLDFFPRGDMGGNNYVSEIWAYGDDGGAVRHDEFLWHSINTNPFIVISGVYQWQLAWAQRILYRYMQHQCAKCVENAFSLDNRGRPLSE